ncbi:MAG: hypothetical protein RR795_01395 [Cetobacterium sp.]|uniref:hypothetical protein n=1 Tax=Cetobacterium sp. TaxID=2071632 RepID=UPI002FC80F2D
MKDKEKKVMTVGNYVIPTINLKQHTEILTDINDVEFEAVFNIPTTKEIMLMEEASFEFTNVDGSLYSKKSKVKKVEWILNNLLQAPAGLTIEHLNKECASGLENLFR